VSWKPSGRGASNGTGMAARPRRPRAADRVPGAARMKRTVLLAVVAFAVIVAAAYAAAPTATIEDVTQTSMKLTARLRDELERQGPPHPRRRHVRRDSDAPADSDAWPAIRRRLPRHRPTRRRPAPSQPPSPGRATTRRTATTSTRSAARPGTRASGTTPAPRPGRSSPRTASCIWSAAARTATPTSPSRPRPG
jgi:hypothetical protein